MAYVFLFVFVNIIWTIHHIYNNFRFMISISAKCHIAIKHLKFKKKKRKWNLTKGYMLECRTQTRTSVLLCKLRNKLVASQQLYRIGWNYCIHFVCILINSRVLHVIFWRFLWYLKCYFSVFQLHRKTSTNVSFCHDNARCVQRYS